MISSVSCVSSSTRPPWLSMATSTAARRSHRTGRAHSTITRNLRALANEGLVEKAPEGWLKTNKDLQEVAKGLGTLGAMDRIRRYNEEQRANRRRLFERGNGGAEESLHEAG